MAVAKFKKGKDGYYSTNIWDGTYTVNGKKHYKHLRSKKSSKDLEKKVKEFQDKVAQRLSIKQNDILFLDYARYWAKLYKSQRASNTKAMYTNIIDVHFKPLEFIQLQNIQRSHLQMILNSAEGKERTKQQIRMTFRQIISSAVSDRLLPANIYDDIFSTTEQIKYKPKEKRTLSPDERKAIFKASFCEMDKIYVFLLYGCGIRKGEALALTVEDFDLENHNVIINKSHSFTSNTPERKCPKSKNGYRTLLIPDKTFPAIKQYIESRKRDGHTYLFVTRTGAPMTKNSYRRMWERILSAMNDVSDSPITGLTAHVFRHNYCTSLCYQIPKISIKMVAKLMGDTEAVVLNVYNHLMMEKEDYENAVNAAVNME